MGCPWALDNLKDDEIILSSTIMHMSPGAHVCDNGDACLFACECAFFVCLLVNVPSFACLHVLQSLPPSPCLVLGRSKCLLNVVNLTQYWWQCEYIKEFVPSRP